MGDSCCKGNAVPDPAADPLNVNVAAGAGTPPEASDEKKKKQVHIRRTIQTEEIELTAEEVAARTGDEDPDLEKLKTESAERQAADGALAPKRAKDRKGTAAPTKVPVVDEVESDEVGSPESGVQKRSKDRKGTGFVKGAILPIEDDEDEDESDEEVAPKS